MKPHLRNGILIPPRSFNQALADHKLAADQVKKIEAQLANPTRITRYATAADYDRWKRSAAHALKLFQSEVQQLDVWLAENEPNLFRRAYDLLNRLELETVFESEETELMRKLDDYFTPGEKRRTA